MKVTVFGSGNGGCATAFDFAIHGHEVSLVDFPEFTTNIDAINEQGGIKCDGVLQGFAKLAYAGFELKDAIESADLIVVVGPAYSTEAIALACKPYLKNGQKVLVSPSSCGGSIVFKKAIGLSLQDDSIWVGETSTLPYAVRVLNPGEVYIYLKLKGGYYLSALPSHLTGSFYDVIKDVYPEVELADNVLQTSLQNANPVIHPSVTLLNASLIQRTDGDFYFYEDGVTQASGRLIEALDKERIEIGKKLGLKIYPDPVIGMKQGYMIEDNYTTGYSKAPGFLGIRAQSSLDNRYITEDVGYGLVFLTDLAQLLGVETPAMDSVLTIASVIMDRDFKSEQARTLETLGFKGLSPTEILQLVR